jgi:hypothetical protein
LAVYRQDRLNSGRFLPFFQGSTFRGRRMTSNILSTGFPAGFTDLAASRVVAAKAAGSPPRNAARQTPPSAIRCTCYQCQAAAAAAAGAVAAGAAAPVNYRRHPKERLQGRRCPGRRRQPLVPPSRTPWGPDVNDGAGRLASVTAARTASAQPGRGAAQGADRAAANTAPKVVLIRLKSG